MENKKIKKVRIGVVKNNKMDKTVVVEVQRVYRHKLYGKIIRTRKKYMSHDEKKQCKIGDMVKIVETKPISKMKRWLVAEVMNKEQKKEVEK